MSQVNNMTFVFLKSTRQVLATATRQALPPNAIPTGSEKKEELAANVAAELKRLVGKELLVRDLPAELLTGATTFDVMASGISFPATELGVVTGDFKPTSFADPRQYFINDDNLAKPGLAPASLIVTIAPTKITVEVTSITQDSNVLVWVFRDDKTKGPIPLDGVIKKDVTPLRSEMPVALTPGAYHALVLLQDFRPVIQSATV